MLKKADTRLIGIILNKYPSHISDFIRKGAELYGWKSLFYALYGQKKQLATSFLTPGFLVCQLTIWALVLLVISTSSGKQADPTCRNSEIYEPTRRDEGVLLGRARNPISKDFFGVEPVPSRWPEAVRKTLPLFSTIGIGVIGRNALDWGYIESTPPAGNVHHYDWRRLDEEFQIYYENGFLLQAVVRLRSPWATIVPMGKLRKDVAGSPPKEMYWDDWGAFIYELVERYDGDGYRDAFKMNRPLFRILSIQGEIEFYGHWAPYGGTAENYTRVLEIAKVAAHRASSQILIARAGLSVGNLFNSDSGRPRDLEVTQLAARKLLHTDAKRRRSAIYNFLQHSFKNPHSYDLFGIHANADYSGILPLTLWLRSEMSRYGPPKKIFIEDASSLLECLGEPLAPSEREQYAHRLYQEAERGILKSLKETERLQAEQTIKKATIALAADVHSILFTGYADLADSEWLSFRIGGFIDTKTLLRTGDVNQSAKKVCYVLREFIKIVVGGYDFRIQDFGEGVWAVSFLKNDIPHYILWKEGYPATIKLKVVKSAPMLIRLPFGDNQTQSTRECLTIDGGEISITLDKYPIILRGSRVKRTY